MCGGKVVKQDPEGDARKAAEEAAIKASIVSLFLFINSP